MGFCLTTSSETVEKVLIFSFFYPGSFFVSSELKFLLTLISEKKFERSTIKGI